MLMSHLPPGPFARLATLLGNEKPGKEPITLAIGDPSGAVPDFISEALAREAKGFGCRRGFDAIVITAFVFMVSSCVEPFQSPSKCTRCQPTLGAQQMFANTLFCKFKTIHMYA